MITLKPRRILTYLAGDILTILVCLIIALYFFKDIKFSKFEWLILSAFTLAEDFTWHLKSKDYKKNI
jgi:hypothetical protein